MKGVGAVVCVCVRGSVCAQGLNMELGGKYPIANKRRGAGGRKKRVGGGS